MRTQLFSNCWRLLLSLQHYVCEKLASHKKLKKVEITLFSSFLIGNEFFSKPFIFNLFNILFLKKIESQIMKWMGFNKKSWTLSVRYLENCESSVVIITIIRFSDSESALSFCVDVFFFIISSRASVISVLSSVFKWNCSCQSQFK